MGQTPPLPGELTFNWIKQEVFEFISERAGWIDEGDIFDYIKGKCKHERLTYWIATSLTSLQYDKLVESIGEFHSLSWRSVVQYK